MTPYANAAEIRLVPEPPCQHCIDWGATVNPDECFYPVQCHACGRYTYPNLGVNLPAGAAVAIAHGNATRMLRLIEQDKPFRLTPYRS